MLNVKCRSQSHARNGLLHFTSVVLQWIFFNRKCKSKTLYHPLRVHKWKAREYHSVACKPLTARDDAPND